MFTEYNELQQLFANAENKLLPRNVYNSTSTSWVIFFFYSNSFCYENFLWNWKNLAIFMQFNHDTTIKAIKTKIVTEIYQYLVQYKHQECCEKLFLGLKPFLSKIFAKLSWTGIVLYVWFYHQTSELMMIFWYFGYFSLILIFALI